MQKTRSTVEQEARHIGRYGIQELDVGGVFDHAVWLLRDNLKLTVIICALIPLPVGCALGIFTTIWSSYFQRAAPNEADIAPLLAVMGGLNLMSILTILVEQPLTMGALFYAYGRSYLGHTPTVRESVRYVLSLYTYLPIMAVGFLSALVQGLGICLCIVPGIIAGVVFCITVPLVVFERANVAVAFERSYRLTWPNFFTVFFVLLALVALGTQGGLLGLLQSFPWVFIPAQAIFRALSYAVGAAVKTSLYFSLRSKEEAYDLDLLARVIDTGPEAGASAL